MSVPALRVAGFWPRLRAALGLLLASGRAGLLGALATLAAGLALNWFFVLWTFRLAGLADGSLLLRATGQVVIVLLFGILAPIGYLVLAKQVGAQAAARKLYGHHREEIIHWVSNAARESAATAAAKAANANETSVADSLPDSPKRVVRSFSQRLASAPRPVAAVVRLLLRRSPLAALLPSLGALAPAVGGSDSRSLPSAVVVQMDALVAGTLTTARRTFRQVIAVNAVVIGILVLAILLR